MLERLEKKTLEWISKKKRRWREYREKEEKVVWEEEEMEEMRRKILLAIPERKPRKTPEKETYKDDEKENMKKKEEDENERKFREKDSEKEVTTVVKDIDEERKLGAIRKRVKVDVKISEKIDEKKTLDSDKEEKERVFEVKDLAPDNILSENISKCKANYKAKKLDFTFNPLHAGYYGGHKYPPKPAVVGVMGYPDLNVDRFGGVQNKVDISDKDIKVTEGDIDVRLPLKSSYKTRVLKLSGVAMDNNQCHLLSEFDDVTNKSSDCDVINRRSKPIVTLKPDEFKSLRKKFESGSRIMKV